MITAHTTHTRQPTAGPGHVALIAASTPEPVLAIDTTTRSAAWIHHNTITIAWTTPTLFETNHTEPGWIQRLRHAAATITRLKDPS